MRGKFCEWADIQLFFSEPATFFRSFGHVEETIRVPLFQIVCLLKLTKQFVMVCFFVERQFASPEILSQLLMLGHFLQRIIWIFFPLGLHVKVRSRVMCVF